MGMLDRLFGRGRRGEEAPAPPPPERATMPSPNGAHTPNTRANGIAKPSRKFTPSPAARRIHSRAELSPPPSTSRLARSSCSMIDNVFPSLKDSLHKLYLCQSNKAVKPRC